MGKKKQRHDFSFERERAAHRKERKTRATIDDGDPARSSIRLLIHSTSYFQATMMKRWGRTNTRCLSLSLSLSRCCPSRCTRTRKMLVSLLSLIRLRLTFKSLSKRKKTKGRFFFWIFFRSDRLSGSESEMDASVGIDGLVRPTAEMVNITLSSGGAFALFFFFFSLSIVAFRPTKSSSPRGIFILSGREFLLGRTSLFHFCRSKFGSVRADVHLHTSASSRFD